MATAGLGGPLSPHLLIIVYQTIRENASRNVAQKIAEKLARFGYYDEFGAPGPWARRQKSISKITQKK